MLRRSCTSAAVTLSGDSEKTQLHNGTDKTINCVITKHAKDGTALDITANDGTVSRKWEWELAAGETKNDSSDSQVVFKSHYYTAIITADGKFIAGFRIHGGPMSWTGPWLEVREETEAQIVELRKNWKEA